MEKMRNKLKTLRKIRGMEKEETLGDSASAIDDYRYSLKNFRAKKMVKKALDRKRRGAKKAEQQCDVDDDMPLSKLPMMSRMQFIHKSLAGSGIMRNAMTERKRTNKQKFSKYRKFPDPRNKKEDDSDSVKPEVGSEPEDLSDVEPVFEDPPAVMRKVGTIKFHHPSDYQLKASKVIIEKLPNNAIRARMRKPWDPPPDEDTDVEAEEVTTKHGRRFQPYPLPNTKRIHISALEKVETPTLLAALAMPSTSSSDAEMGDTRRQCRSRKIPLEYHKPKGRPLTDPALKGKKVPKRKILRREGHTVIWEPEPVPSLGPYSSKSVTVSKTKPVKKPPVQRINPPVLTIGQRVPVVSPRIILPPVLSMSERIALSTMNMDKHPIKDRLKPVGVHIKSEPIDLMEPDNSLREFDSLRDLASEYATPPVWTEEGATIEPIDIKQEPGLVQITDIKQEVLQLDEYIPNNTFENTSFSTSNTALASSRLSEEGTPNTSRAMEDDLNASETVKRDMEEPKQSIDLRGLSCSVPIKVETVEIIDSDDDS